MNLPFILWKTVCKHEQTTEILITIYLSSVFLILQPSQVWLFKLNIQFLTEKFLKFPMRYWLRNFLKPKINAKPQ